MKGREREPLREQPEPEKQPQKAFENHLEKPGLDLRSADQALALVRKQQMAVGIARLPEREPSQNTTPLELFGVVIGALRRKQGLALDELAGRAGLDPADLLAVEMGAASFEQVSGALRPVGDALGDKYRYLSNVLVSLSLGEE